MFVHKVALMAYLCISFPFLLKTYTEKHRELGLATSPAWPVL